MSASGRNALPLGADFGSHFSTFLVSRGRRPRSVHGPGQVQPAACQDVAREDRPFRARAAWSAGWSLGHRVGEACAVRARL